MWRTLQKRYILEFYTFIMLTFMRKNLLFLICLFTATLCGAQTASLFTPVSISEMRLEKELLRNALPSAYLTYQLDRQLTQTVLQSAPQEFTAAASGQCTISIPLADGSFEPFAIWKTAMLEPALAAKFPDVRTYAGRSLRNRERTVRLSYTPRGFRAMVMQPNLEIVFIEPYSWNQDRYYIVYDAKTAPDNPNQKLERRWIPEGMSGAMDAPDEKPFAPTVQDRGIEIDPVKLKVFRFCVATTGEFAQDHGNTKPMVFAAVTEYVNMISGFFERDIDMRLQLIDASQNVVFTNPDSDPYEGLEVGNWMGQNPAVLDFYCGTASHDVGHVLARYIQGGAIGVAGGITCGDGKDRGCSAGTGNGDYGAGFLGTFGQEVGHQMSGGHSWNRCAGIGGRAGLTAFEPGGGSTIMSYAGACQSDNIQFNQDLYYHSGSIEEMRNFYLYNLGTTCGSYITTDNHAPIVTLPYQDNFFIPISTPFELNGSAIDPDGDTMVYNWEGMDAGPETPLGFPQGNAAIFRTLPAVSETNRYFPKLQTVITNGSSNAEQLPTYTRDLTFRLAARDNRPNGGGVGWADVAFKSWEAAGPFKVTNPNTGTVSWKVGELANVVWDVAHTNVVPVNCQKVNIRLSIDGGFTYPIMLAEGVTNDGSQYVPVPNQLTTKARVRVDAADNVFFDISNANFKIEQPAQPTFTFGLASDVSTICLPGVFTTEILSAGVLGFNSPVNLTVDGNFPPGVITSFTQNTITPGGQPSTLNIDLNQVAVSGTFVFNVKAVVAGNTDTLVRPITLSLLRNDFSGLALDLPVDGTQNLGLIQSVYWNKGLDAQTYDVQVSKSATFDVILATKTNTALDTFKIPVQLEKSTAYYWRVRPINECGPADWTEPFFFSTYVENCNSFTANDLPKTISANGTPSVESKIVVNSGGTISDINITKIKGNHEFFKDLNARLISPSGTEVILFADKCGNTNGPFDFGLDDVAPGGFICPPPNNGGFARPQNFLSAFNGQNSTGTWTLRIKDNVIGSGGSLSNFGLEFCATATPQPPYIVNNKVLFLDPSTNAGIPQDLLLVEDANNSHSQLTYTLLSVPKYGILQKNFGGALKIGDQFKQTDIDNGALRFFDYGAKAGPDGFRFVVSDGEGGYLATPKFIIQTEVVGTNDPNESRLNFDVFPNPAFDGVWVALNRNASSDMRVSLFDLAGRLMQESQMDAGADRLNISVQNLPRGMYVVRVEGADGVGVRKLILK